MKKLMVLLSLLLTLGMSFAQAETAPVTYTSNGFDYILLEDGSAMITGYYGKHEELCLPATLGFEKAPVSALGDFVFTTAYDLEKLIIPEHVTHIGEGCFAGMSQMQIVVSPDHPTLAVIDGALFCKADKSLIWYPAANSVRSCAIPQGIRSVRSYAFHMCKALVSVQLPNTMEHIGKEAFYFCPSLESINLPDGLKAIGSKAFAFCNALTELYIPASVTEIGEDAFRGCSSLTITVERGSYAAQYCEEHNLLFNYPDSNDWLLN